MIKLWNETVNEDDMVIIMGDFIKRREPEYALYILNQLNGQKALIRGNHDEVTRDKEVN